MMVDSISAMNEMSCKFVEEILWFGYWDTGPCCVPLRSGTPPRYRTIRSLEKVEPKTAALDLLACRRELADKIWSEPPPACTACQFLHKQTKGKDSDILFSGVILSHAEICNLKCTYCYQAAPGYQVVPKPSFSPIPIIEALMELRSFKDRPHAFWGGGEPTLGPAFAKEILRLSQLGFSQTVNSNCTVYQPELARLLKEDPWVALVCSVDAGCSATYKQVKGRDCWERVWTNIRNYREHSEKVVLKFIALPENAHEVEAFLEIAAASGVTTFLVDLDCGLSGNLNEHDPMIIDACKLLVRRINENGLKVGWAGNALNTLQDPSVTNWIL